MRIEPGAPNDLVIKREKAIEYLKERGIWRGDPQCCHEWQHDPDDQFHEATKIIVVRRVREELESI